MPRYRSTVDTVTLMRLVMHRAGQTRGRISRKTVSRLAGRQRLRASYLAQLIDVGLEEGLLIVELNTGAFGIMPVSSLAGAKTIVAKNVLSEEERKAITKDTIDMDAVSEELGDIDEENDDEEDE